MRNVYKVGVWKTIRKGWDLFNSEASFEVGSRKRVKFWKAKWSRKEPLCVSFPSLYVLVVSKEVWVAD